MASAKAFALGMQGEKSFGGSGAPAHLCRLGYQRCYRIGKLSLSGPPNVRLQPRRPHHCAAAGGCRPMLFRFL